MTSSSDRAGSKLDRCSTMAREPDFSMAFQPIVNVESAQVYAYEALVRGTSGESAMSVLCQIDPSERHVFDQNCRVKAISLAAKIGLLHGNTKLSINFLPSDISRSDKNAQLTIEVAKRFGFQCGQLLFEITEAEKVSNHERLVSNLAKYRTLGLSLAIDDFGSGYAGLALLANVAADVIKIDQNLVRNLPRRPTAYAIVKMLSALSTHLGVKLIAEGVESEEEYSALRDCEITLMQGFLLGKPAFESAPATTIPFR